MRAPARDSELMVKAMYRVPELAAVTGISGDAMLMLLKRNGVSLVYSNPEATQRKHGLVPLSEIETKMPLLWRSLVAAESIRAGVRVEKVREDDDESDIG